MKNVDQKDEDENGVGDECQGDNNDFDGDGIVDEVDNCVMRSDASQTNTFEGRESLSSATGNVCDNNMDGDRRPNDVDPCPFLRSGSCFVPRNDDPYQANGPDADGDKIPDYLDQWYTRKAISGSYDYNSKHLIFALYE